MKKILVTGGLGYLGSHMVIELIYNGYTVVCVDNLHNSSEDIVYFIESIVKEKIEFVKANVEDTSMMEVLFSKYTFDAVNHFAGYKSIAESLKIPLEYYQNNYNSTLTILRLCLKYNSTFISSDNEIITDSINKFIDMNSGGKYIRATLIDLGYKISGNNDYYAIPLGVAYETFQTAILVHDDIIDNASLRRDKVTIPYKYISELKSTKYKDKVTEAANSLGICLGDLGFFYANKIIMDNYSLDKNITLQLQSKAFSINLLVFSTFIPQHFSYSFWHISGLDTAAVNIR